MANPTAGGKETTRASSREESSKVPSGDVVGICALLKPDLLEDIDMCAKFVDGVKEIVGPSLFAKHTSEYRKTALLSMMQKTTILAAESMSLDQEDAKAAKEMAKTMAAEACFLAERTKELESELVALKGSTVSAPNSLQLEAARQEIVDLKARLDVIQVKYESAEKEIKRYVPQIQDLEHSISKFRSAAYAKDEELIAAYNQVTHFKKAVGRLEPQVSELQSTLQINDNLKKEIEELQQARACLLEENKQLKDEKARYDVSLTQNQADFYKLGYVDHLYGRPSDFEFSGKDFETFSISPEDLFAFSFESSLGEVVGEVGAKGKTPDDHAAGGTTAAGGVATE